MAEEGEVLPLPCGIGGLGVMGIINQGNDVVMLGIISVTPAVLAVTPPLFYESPNRRLRPKEESVFLHAL